MIFWNLMLGSSSAQRASILLKSGMRTSLPATKAVSGPTVYGRSAGTWSGRGWNGTVAGSGADSDRRLALRRKGDREAK